MNPNTKPSNRAPLVGVIDPDAYAAATYTTGWISMATFHEIMATIMAGTMVTNAVLSAKLEQATDSGGTGAKDVTGKAITNLTEAGTDSDKQAIINCRADELDVDGGFDYVRLSVTLATAGSDMGATVHGFDARYQPAADLASVDEVVG